MCAKKKSSVNHQTTQQNSTKKYTAPANEKPATSTADFRLGDRVLCQMAKLGARPGTIIEDPENGHALVKLDKPYDCLQGMPGFFPFADLKKLIRYDSWGTGGGCSG